jgi:hypothetical protein
MPISPDVSIGSAARSRRDRQPCGRECPPDVLM